MKSRLTDYRIFLREFRKTYRSTGAILPSSNRLGNKLAHFVREGLTPDKPRRILEVGPGTGAVTNCIAAAMGPEDRLDLVELNDRFVDRLKERLVSDAHLSSIANQVEIFHADLRELPEDREYDVIVSGLPLNNFPVDLVQELLAALQKFSAPGGTLSFFEYIAIRKVKAAVSSSAERNRLRQISDMLGSLLQSHEIRRDKVLTNVPPAWVHHLQFA